MIPVKLQLKNFMSYRQPEVVDFTGFDLAILNGDNGAGKSSLLEAITWAVWGKSRAQSDDDLVHQGETTMWVEFIFDYEGNRYRILRQREARGRGSTSLEFQVAEDHRVGLATPSREFAISWKALTMATIRDTQASIISTLKLDYDLFVNSSYLRQGHADEFTTKIPAQRKEILADILDLALYDQLEQKAKELRRNEEIREQLLTTQLIDLRERVGGKAKVEQELAALADKKADRDAELAKKEKELKKHTEERQEYATVEKELIMKRRRFEEAQEEGRRLAAEYAKEQANLKESSQILEKKNEIEKRYEQLLLFRKQYESLNEKFKEAAKVEQSLRVLEHREQELSATMDRLRHITVCPTCLRSMSKKEAEAIINRLHQQFLKEFIPERKKLEGRLSTIGYNRKEHDKIREQLVVLESQEAQMRRLAVAKANQQKSKEILVTITDKQQRVYETLKKLKAEGKLLARRLKILSEKKPVWDALEGEVSVLRTELAALQDALGGLKASLKSMYDIETQIADKTRELQEAMEKKTLYNDLADSAGKKGVQAMIIEQTIPQIEEKANELLEKITGGRMQVTIETQREKKGKEGGIMETLDIIIRDELGARPYEQYSGGEAFRINFAIRIALAKLLAMRASAKLRFLVIDEGFGTLDASGREDIVAAISGIREEFSKIIIVTHIEEFKNLFPTRVEVTKDANGSHIQVISQ